MEGYILVAVFLCPVTDISATVAPIGMKFCMMLHIGLGQIFSPLGRHRIKGIPVAVVKTASITTVFYVNISLS